VVSAVWLWCARAVWASLPLTAGDALTDALDDWSRAPARVAAVLLWLAWVVTLVAVLAPRPWGVTVARITAPAAVVAAAVAAPAASSASALVAVAAAVAAAVLVTSAPVVEAAGNALAYGDEQRFTLRVPTPLLLAPVPLAVALVAAGATAGPLLVAAGEPLAGVPLVLVGVPAAAYAARALHSLARRWVVLVPAGLVVVDPLTLADPVLVRREQVAALGPGAGPPGAGALDLRLGTSGGSLRLVTREPVTLTRRTGRATAEARATTEVLVAPVRPAALLAAAHARRIPVP
jgi:hypothetical protein